MAEPAHVDALLQASIYQREWSEVAPLWAAALVAAIAALLAAAQVYLIYQQARRNEIILLQDLRRGWLEVKPSWEIALVCALGPENHYAPSVPRAYLDDLTYVIDQSINIRELMMMTVDALRGGDPAILRKIGALHESIQDPRRRLEGEFEKYLTYLVQLADLVLGGRASVPLAYSVVGAELARFSKPLRVILGRTPAQTDQLQRFWMEIRPLRGGEGPRTRIIALVDLLWAEAVRRGDLSGHTIREVAELKRTSGSGKQARRRVRLSSRQGGGSYFYSWRLSRSLRSAEHPRRRAI